MRIREHRTAKRGKHPSPLDGRGAPHSVRARALRRGAEAGAAGSANRQLHFGLCLLRGVRYIRTRRRLTRNTSHVLLCAHTGDKGQKNGLGNSERSTIMKRVYNQATLPCATFPHTGIDARKKSQPQFTIAGSAAWDCSAPSEKDDHSTAITLTAFGRCRPPNKSDNGWSKLSSTQHHIRRAVDDSFALR